MTKHIFLSYSSKSKEQTSKLAKDLERMGHEVWFDQALSGGQIWWDEICKNIRKCELFIFVLDKNSQFSQACEVEWRYAIDLGSEILPIKITNDVSEKTLPTALAKCHIFDYSERGIESFHNLKKQIQNIPMPVKLANALPPQPPAPVSYLVNLAEQVGTFDRLSKFAQDGLVKTLKRMIRDGTDSDEASILLSKLESSGHHTDESPKQKNNRKTDRGTSELTSNSKGEEIGAGCGGALVGFLLGLPGGTLLVSNSGIALGPSTTWLVLILIFIATVICVAIGAWLAIRIQRWIHC